MSLFFSGPAYRPMVYTSDAQRASEADQRRLLGTDSGLLGAGALRTATASIMYDAIGLTYPDDPEWTIDEQKIEELGAGLHPSYWPVLGQSRSREHAEFLRRQLFDRQTADEILSTNGWSGTGAMFLTGALDPAFLITTAGAGSLLRAGMLARTAAMGPAMSRAITEGAVATAGMAVPQLYLQATDPTVTTGETMIALGLAASLGGLAGGIGGRLTAREARSLEDLARAGKADVMVESAGAMGAMGATETRDAMRRAFVEQLTEKGRKYFSSLTAKKQFAVLDEVANDGDEITRELVDEFKKSEAGTAFFTAAETFDDTAYLAGPERTRVAKEMKEAFGGDDIMPVVDAYAKGWARAQGKSVDDYYRTLRVEKGGKPGDGALFMTAHHGTPHTFQPESLVEIGGKRQYVPLGQEPEGATVVAQFPMGRFDLGKIGTGEGNQSFGHGLYFAGSRDVADWYRRNLSQVAFAKDGLKLEGDDVLREYFKAGRVVPTDGGEHDRVISFSASGDGRWSVKVRQVELRDGQWVDKPGSATRTHATAPDAAQVRGVLESEGWKDSSGRLYTVDLKPAEDEYLLWDKPLSEQSEKVRKALTDAGIVQGTSSGIDGKTIYRSLAEQLSSNPEAASQALREAGIRGIKYLDGSSRARGGGHFNYVIFDDADVSILNVQQRAAGAAEAMGSYELKASGQRIIRALTNPNASTLPHEVAHDFLTNLPQMDEALAQRAARALGAEDFAKIGVKEQEQFARGFEAYLRTGNAPSEDLRSVFQKFKEFLLDIYRTIKGTPLEGQMNGELKSVFDDMLTRGRVEPMSDTLPRGGPNVYEVIDPNAPKATVADEALGEAADGGDGPGTVQKTAFDFNFEWAKQGDWARLSFGRFSNAAFFGRRKSRLARVIGSASIEDALAKVGDDGTRSVSGDNATSAVRRLFRAKSGEIQTTFNEALDGHFKARGIRGTKQDVNWFYEQVGRSVAGLNIGDTFVQQAAQKLRTVFAEFGEAMKRAGVEAFKDFNPNDNYFTRVWSPARMNMIVADKGETAVISTLRNAIAQRQPEIAEATRDFLANTLYKGVQRRGLLSADTAARAMLGGLDDIEATLKVGLSDASGALSDEAKQSIDAAMGELRRLSAERQGTGVPMGKKRILLDEFAVDPDTGLKVDDFLERDARVIANQYIRSATGALAEKEVLRVFALAVDPTGKTPVRSWQAATEIVEKDLIASGEQSKIRAVLHRMDIIHRMIRGLPLQDADQMRTLAHYATTYNQAVYGGSFVLANIPETLASLAEVPVKNTLMAIRSVGNIAEMFRLRKQPRGLVGEIMSVTGRGSDYALSELTRRFDPVEGTFIEPNRFVRGVNRLIDFQSKYTGFAALNDFSQRYTALAPAVEIVNKAARGVSYGTATRTLAMGIDEEMYKAIGRNAKHVVYKTVDGAKVIDSFNLEAWEPQVAAKFIVALQRNSERMVQQVDFGQMAPWMTTWWGSIIRQLRTFTIAAWDKQLLHGLDTLDQKTVARFTVGTTTGALVYIARQHLMSLGQEESKRQEFLDDMLSPGRIVAAAWANGGYASLTPDLIDWSKYVFVDRFDQEASPIFTARYSQLQSRGLLSNPTSSTAMRAGMAFKGMLGATTESGEFTQRDINNLTRILPLQNAMGIRQLLNYTVSQFPEDER